MKTLSISTDEYYKELDDYTQSFARRIKKRDQNSIKVYYEEFDAADFYQFLDWVVFQENPALKCVAKLAEITKKNIPKAIEQKNIKELAEYISSNRTIHLEGYIKFRMDEYNDYLNRVLYAIIKKLNM
ncbi:MAG: putative sporulation protein YtxC [Clostridiales bacterium]|jgi:hypothetical protein|nr:putative sporulation protein YtxC [Clostridiales bacterium]